MTTVVDDILDVLQTAAPAGGVWYATNTQTPPTYPYATFIRITSQATNDLQGKANLQNTNVQLDVFGRSQTEAMTAHAALEAALLGGSLTIVALSSTDMYEGEVRAYRISSDWSVWATN